MNSTSKKTTAKHELGTLKLRKEERMRRNVWLTVLSFVLALAAAQTAAADVPHQMHYQGHLTDSGGSPLDTTISMTFAIYNDSSTGSLVLWTETQTSVEVSGGLFNVLLGSVTPIPDTVFDSDWTWLGIQIGSDPEIIPRTKLVTVPYAFRVGTVDGSTGGVISGDVSIQSDLDLDGDLRVNGKARIGPDNINTGDYAFAAGSGNSATGNGSAVGGGAENQALFISSGVQPDPPGGFSTVGGGNNNRALGDFSTVGGGEGNTAQAGWTPTYGGHSTVGGGEDNSAFAKWSTVGGGQLDSALAEYATVGGGHGNRAGTGTLINPDSGQGATVAGGRLNWASGNYSAICGGFLNQARGDNCAVGGGYSNLAGNWECTVGGGYLNTANGFQSTVSGGYQNTANGHRSSSGGGMYNAANGDYSVVPGGQGDSTTSAAHHSMAFGRAVYVDTPYRVAFFDGTNSGRLGINRDDRDSGGIAYPIHVGTDLTNGNGAYLTNGGAWMGGSSRSFKEHFRPLDAEELLSKIRSLPVESWQFRNTNERHIGPVSEDFVGAFDVGVIRDDGSRDNKYLCPGDVAGVALAGVKELIEENQELKKAVEELKQRIADLESAKASRGGR
jgi:hypothetical protein